jgi:hypothetical protein
MNNFLLSEEITSAFPKLLGNCSWVLGQCTFDEKKLNYLFYSRMNSKQLDRKRPVLSQFVGVRGIFSIVWVPIEMPYLSSENLLCITTGIHDINPQSI